MICMKITLGLQIFNTIEEFTDYLKSFYKKNKSLSKEISLQLECENIETSDVVHLVEFLINKKQVHLFKLELRPNDPGKQLALDNAYLICKRRRFSRNVQQQISDLLGRSVSSKPIRKAKKHWVEETPGESIGIQIMSQKQKIIKRIPKKPGIIEEPKITNALPVEPKVIVGSSKQFDWFSNGLNKARYEEEFNRLLTQETPVEQCKGALIFFLGELETDQEKLTLIQKLLDSLPLNLLNYQGLGKILLNSGVDGVLLILHQFSVLHKKALLEHFIHVFMDNSEHYVALTTPLSLEQLEKLGQMTAEQRSWWTSLVTQHQESGKPTHFNDLFAEYERFLKECAQISRDLKLPPLHSLKNATDMKSVLDRILFILNNSTDPKEQILYLDGLDFGEKGAYFASRFNGYKLVSPHMKLTPNGEGTIDYPLSQNPAEIAQLLTKPTYEEMATQFYRVIGLQDWAFSLDFYRKIEHEIATNLMGKTRPSKKVQAQLFILIALSTTGKRACTKMEVSFNYTDFLKKIVQFAHLFDENPESDEILKLITHSFSKALSSCHWNSMPTLCELEALLDILLVSQMGVNEHELFDKLDTLIPLMFNLIDIYDAAVMPFLVNFKNRLIRKQTQLELEQVLSHLVGESKLKQFLCTLFKEQSESLTQFMVLMSLCSNEITKATFFDQPDSEFEIKVKNLAQAIQALPEEHQTLLLKILTHIDVENSAFLPSLEQLIRITSGIDAKILKAFDQVPQKEAVSLLLEIQEGLEVHSFYLNDIIKLFNYVPYPELKELAQFLKGNGRDLKAYLINFDKDPKQGRWEQCNKLGVTEKSARQVIEEQFDNTRIACLVEKIQTGIDPVSLSSQEQYDLAQQITYINSIGKQYPLVIKNNKNTFDEYYLTQITREQLGQISDHLIEILRNSHSSKKKKLKAELNLLAVLREQYFRATGNFINTTQLGIVLLSLKGKNHVLMQLNQNEKNSDILALLSAMEWVNTFGNTVDVCVPHRAMLNCAKSSQEFFMALGIKFSSILGDSPEGTYQIGGINYSTLADLTLYSSQARLRGEQLKNESQNFRSLILSQESLVTFDEQTLFSLAANEKGFNPYTWIYPLVNEFIIQEQFKDLNPKTNWGEKKDLTNLKEFLIQHASTQIESDQLNDLSDSLLNSWINAAIAAQRLVEGEDFYCSKSSDGTYVAIPYYLKTPQEGAVFSKGVHQFLHARLQKQYSYKEWTFSIEAESVVIDSASSHELIHDYKVHGRIIGLAEFLGTKDILSEQCRKFDADKIYTIPSHKEGYYKELTPIQAKKNTQDQLREIKEIIAKVPDGQPLVLIAKDVQEAKYLKMELKTYFDQLNIEAFESHRTEDARKKWIKHHAGQNNTLTIITSQLLDNSKFHTQHKDGFLAIQTPVDSQNNLRSTLNHAFGTNKLGQYTAIYENHNRAFSKSWTLESKEEYQIITTDLATLNKKLSNLAKIEHHYSQKAFRVREVIINQLDEWQEFLRFIYPQSELHQLNNELLTQKDELIGALGEQWLACLDPEKNYINPYERIDKQGKLQTAELENALKQFETIASNIWEKHRNFLKSRANPKIEKGSVNELRCNYLANISFLEQLKLNKIEEVQKQTNLRREREKARHRVAYALDAEASMLCYAEGELEPYRAHCARNQTELLKKDMTKIIANNNSLGHFKKLALQQIRKAENLNQLVWILNDYANYWLQHPYFYKKYELQPIVQELLRIYKDLKLQAIPELKGLKKTYIKNVVNELVRNLKSNLDWAVKDNRGLTYRLERTKVTRAAKDILEALSELEGAEEKKSYQSSVKNLYKVLAQHEAKLEGLWILSLGHKNTRTLIKKTRATLDELIAIGSNKKGMDANFIRDCKEEAIYSVLCVKFNAVVDTIEKKQAIHGKEWECIKDKLNIIQKGYNSVYSFKEMDSFLLDKIDLLSKKNSNLVGPLTQMHEEILKLWEECSQKHKDLIDENNYFDLKSQKMKLHFNNSKGFKAEQITLKVAHCGFNDYVDLLIKAQGNHPLIANFVQYNSQHNELVTQYDEIIVQLNGCNEDLLQLEKVKYEQLSLLTSKEIGNADPKLFPKQYGTQVEELIQLKNYARDQYPKDLTVFSTEAQMHFRDRELIKTFDFENLILDELSKIENPKLKTEFIELYKKKNPEKPQSFLGKLVNYASEFIFPQVDGYLRDQFNQLLVHPKEQLENILFPLINQQQKILAGGIDGLHQEKLMQKKVLEQKRDFLEWKISKEEKKGGLYYKRFENMNEFYDFEAKLQESSAPYAQRKSFKSASIGEEELSEFSYSTPGVSV
jgi:hypothetical protein